MRARKSRLAVALMSLLMPVGARSQSGPTQQDLNDAARSTENWLHPNHDYAGTRFVDLKQINRSNAGSLRPVCLYQSKERVPSQSSPLVYKGVLYFTTMHYTLAIDATNCKLRWEHFWKQHSEEPFRTSRGAAIRWAPCRCSAGPQT